MFLFYSCWRFFSKSLAKWNYCLFFQQLLLTLLLYHDLSVQIIGLNFISFGLWMFARTHKTIKIDDDSRVCARKHSLALSNQFVLSNVSMNNNNRFKWKRTQTHKMWANANANTRVRIGRVRVRAHTRFIAVHASIAKSSNSIHWHYKIVHILHRTALAQHSTERAREYNALINCNLPNRTI